MGVEINIPEIEEINQKLDLVVKILEERIIDPKYVIYDKKGAMQFMSIGRTKLYELTSRGKLAHSKDETGKTWYKLIDLMDYIDSIRHEKF